MKRLVNGEQMRRFDQYTIRCIGIPSMVLMERAALAAADEISDRFGDLSRVLVLCGSGNNGGDGLAIARLLRVKGYQAEVFFLGKSEHMTQECAAQRQIFTRLGGVVHTGSMPQPGDYDVIVDALFGVGLSRPLEGEYADAVSRINACRKPVVAIDLPSGISADDGAVLGTAVKAELTVTFSFLKYGQVLFPGRDFCGEVVLHDVGIVEDPSFPAAGRLIEQQDILRLLPGRPARSNKGTFGRAVLAAGCRGMAGAAMLSSRAASRSGCGLVHILSHQDNRTILQSTVPEAVYTAWNDFLESDPEKADVLTRAAAIGTGPGLGCGETSLELLVRILKHRKQVPLILDADALNLLSSQRNLLDAEGLLEGCVLTPHPGEMARLCGISVREVMDHPVETAVSFAAAHHTVVALKDATTVVTDGKEVWLNTTGCSGLACGGSGDVLTGLITGLAAQGLTVMEAAVAGVWLHGKAGEAASKESGMRGMNASDLPGALCRVMMLQCGD